MMTTWKKEIEDVLPEGQKIISCTLSEAELSTEFYAGYGGTNGEPFTAWSEDWVFFPICYDGAEWVGKAPRNPCALAMGHEGGG